MTDPGLHHHLEIKDGGETVAAADVTTPPEAEGTAQASLRAAPGHIPPGRRATLVDAVMDLPAVQESSRLEAALPLGDSETLGRLRERSENSTTRPAGVSALLDADIPPGPPDQDTGRDAAPDAGRDAAPDAGRDAGPDAGRDAAPDAGRDAGPDAGQE